MENKIKHNWEISYVTVLIGSGIGYVFGLFDTLETNMIFITFILLNTWIILTGIEENKLRTIKIRNR